MAVAIPVYQLRVVRDANFWTESLRMGGPHDAGYFLGISFPDPVIVGEFQSLAGL